MNHNYSIRIGEIMSYKIQITVDRQLDKQIKDGAEQMGLSVSSYARLVLKSVLSRKNNKLIDHAIEDIRLNKVDTLTLAEFKHQLDNL